MSDTTTAAAADTTMFSPCTMSWTSLLAHGTLAAVAKRAADNNINHGDSNDNDGMPDMPDIPDLSADAPSHPRQSLHPAAALQLLQELPAAMIMMKEIKQWQERHDQNKIQQQQQGGDHLDQAALQQHLNTILTTLQEMDRKIDNIEKQVNSLTPMYQTCWDNVDGMLEEYLARIQASLRHLVAEMRAAPQGRPRHADEAMVPMYVHAIPDNSSYASLEGEI